MCQMAWLEYCIKLPVVFVLVFDELMALESPELEMWEVDTIEETLNGMAAPPMVRSGVAIVLMAADLELELQL